MSELKITIDQLKNYLGTGLKCHAPSIDIDYRRDANIPVEFQMYGLTDNYAMIDCSVLQTDSEYDDLKPICYRLSDLDKFIPELGFAPLDELKRIWAEFGANDSELMFDSVYFDIKVPQPGCDYIGERDDSSCWIAVSNSFEIYQKLFQWHFWPFGDEYFEQGLVIDKLILQGHA